MCFKIYSIKLYLSFLLLSNDIFFSDPSTLRGLLLLVLLARVEIYDVLEELLGLSSASVEVAEFLLTVSFLPIIFDASLI